MKDPLCFTSAITKSKAPETPSPTSDGRTVHAEMISATNEVWESFWSTKCHRDSSSPKPMVSDPAPTSSAKAISAFILTFPSQCAQTMRYLTGSAERDGRKVVSLESFEKNPTKVRTAILRDILALLPCKWGDSISDPIAWAYSSTWSYCRSPTGIMARSESTDFN